jgi:hypothetical protein
MKGLVIGGPGPYIPFPSHSFLVDMGPDQWMLLLDCRFVVNTSDFTPLLPLY